MFCVTEPCRGGSVDGFFELAEPVVSLHETACSPIACGLDRDGAIFVLRNEPRDHHGVQGHSEPIPALPEFRFENRVLVLHRLKRAER